MFWGTLGQISVTKLSPSSYSFFSFSWFLHFSQFWFKEIWTNKELVMLTNVWMSGQNKSCGAALAQTCVHPLTCVKKMTVSPEETRWASCPGRWWRGWRWRTQPASASSACDTQLAAVCSCPWGTVYLYGDKKNHIVGICAGQKASGGTVKSCKLTKHAVDWANEDVVLFGDFGDEYIRRVRSISHLKITKKRTEVNHRSNKLIQTQRWSLAKGNGCEV